MAFFSLRQPYTARYPDTVRIYLLSLLCLILAIVILEPQHLESRQYTYNNFANFANSTSSRVPQLQLPPDSLNLDQSLDDAQGGYVFSLTVNPSNLQNDLQSALTDKSSESSVQPQSNSANDNDNKQDNIISLSNEITISKSPQNRALGPLGELSSLTAIQLVILTLGILAASIVQGLFGYAFSLTAIPLIFNIVNYSLVEAILFVSLLALILKSNLLCYNAFIYRVYRGYRASKHQYDLSLEIVWPAMFLRIAGLLVGLFLLAIAVQFQPPSLIQIITGLVLILTIIQFVLLISTWQIVSTKWLWLSSVISELLRGATGLGAAFPYWLNLNDLNDESYLEKRSLINASLWAILPIQIILLFGMYGQNLLPIVGQAFIFLPIGLVGLWLGVWCSNKLSRNIKTIKTLEITIHFLILLVTLALLLWPLINS